MTPSHSPLYPTPILFITIATDSKQRGGREMLGELHEAVLRQIVGPELVTYRLPPVPAVRGRLGKALTGLRGHIDGVGPVGLREIDRLVRSRTVRSAYLNGSNLGEVAAHLKREHPTVHVFTFCHNVESRFFWGAFRSRPSADAAAVTAINYLAERKAARHSDTLICINRRDSELMRRTYGRAGDAVVHMALRDEAPPEVHGSAPTDGRYVLFVGGSFYANRVGVEWFTSRVSPHLKLPTYIIGRGFEAIRQGLEAHSQVRLIGEVDSLAAWYAAADVVVAPIFDGSGMKTKVAEALMHGKLVVGTAEAFVGYDDVPAELRFTCETEDEFIRVLNGLDAGEWAGAAARLRALYVAHYSPDAVRRALESILRRADGKSSSKALS